jgi:N-acetylneuraminate synthase/sialic acid synthase
LDSKKNEIYMRQITIANKKITDNDVYVIAEIGSNHNGSFRKCAKMVRRAAECGADAVKFQKRYNDVLFTKEELAKPYTSKNAYGATYGEHRNALDWFDRKEFVKLKNLCASLDLGFIVTPFEWKSALFLAQIGVDAFKIASCDVRTPGLIKQVSEYGQPVILSTGGASVGEIRNAVNVMEDNGAEYAILHCVSLYPNEDKDLNLVRIQYLRYSYCDRIIGFSSHHPGLDACKDAYHQGARIFEVHFTLNRADKGTDHSFSLEPSGLRQLCEDLRRIPVRIGKADYNPSEKERNGFTKKFGKSVYARMDIEANMVINYSDIWEKFEAKAPKIGVCASKMDYLAGKRIRRYIPAGRVIKETDLAT